jgi:hypothetical protein
LKIARAFAEIGSVLPELDFIAQKLFPVESILNTLALVYCQVLEFCIRATKWYNDIRKSTLKKVWHSFAKPWSLEFEDIRTQIDYYVRRLREQSDIAHQAEMRDIHYKVSEMQLLIRHNYVVQTNTGEGLFLSRSTRSLVANRFV